MLASANLEHEACCQWRRSPRPFIPPCAPRAPTTGLSSSRGSWAFNDRVHRNAGRGPRYAVSRESSCACRVGGTGSTGREPLRSEVQKDRRMVRPLQAQGSPVHPPWESVPLLPSHVQQNVAPLHLTLQKAVPSLRPLLRPTSSFSACNACLYAVSARRSMGLSLCFCWSTSALRHQL